VKKNKIGFLLVISGASGAGKDTVMENLLEHPAVKTLNLRKVVTCTDRQPRPGEVHKVHYHFVTNEKLQEMARNGELVEEITPTGSSNKATPKSEIERLFKGEDLVWRIDPSRAAEVASGTFFERHFPNHARVLQKSTTVFCVNASKDSIEARRKERDGVNYDPSEYAARDKQELPHLHILQEKAIIMENSEGCLEETVNLAAGYVKSHYEKAKKRRA